MLLSALLPLLLPPPSALPVNRYEFEQPCMGTLARLVLYAPEEAAARKAADQAFERMQAINRIMSDYQEQSELMQLCRKPAGQPHTISPELSFVLQKSQRMAELSEGAFDVTVGPLSRLWRRARRQKQPPTAEEIAKARLNVGFRNLEVDAEKRRVLLRQPGMILDLGGIAKGYAADEALAHLKRSGYERALVVLGGEVVTGSPPPTQKAWKVRLGTSTQGQTEAEFLYLTDRAVSTSGDAEQFLEWKGRRFSHILDPRTGYGRTVSPIVTVVAPQGVDADALATAMSLLAPEKAMALAAQFPGVEARILDPHQQPPKTWQTCGWSRWLSEP